MRTINNKILSALVATVVIAVATNLYARPMSPVTMNTFTETTFSATEIGRYVTEATAQLSPWQEAWANRFVYGLNDQERQRFTELLIEARNAGSDFRSGRPTEAMTEKAAVEAQEIVSKLSSREKRTLRKMLRTIFDSGRNEQPVALHQTISVHPTVAVVE